MKTEYLKLLKALKKAQSIGNISEIVTINRKLNDLLKKISQKKLAEYRGLK